jgi:hypothetical protein
MHSILDAVRSTEFLTGLAWGGAGLGAGLIVAAAWRRLWHSPAPIVGLLLAAAAWVAMSVARSTPDALWQGLAMLAVAGALFPWTRKVPLLPAVLAAPGAWWVTQRLDLPGAVWVVWLLFATIVLGAPLVASFDRAYRDRGFGPLLLAVTVMGAFSTLPDTEEVLVLVGAALPLMLLAWPKVLARIGPAGAYPVVGLFAWVTAWGGRGRETAIIGAVAGLGVLIAEPLARWVNGRVPLASFPRGPLGAVLAAVVQVIVVVLTARLAGLQSDLLLAAAIGVAVLLAAAMALALVPGPHGRRH